jgi:phosphatidylglycerophosphatase A
VKTASELGQTENSAGAGGTPVVPLLLATWFGCGYSPVAPGTVGSAGAVAAAILVVNVGGWPPWTLGLLALVLLAPSIVAASATARHYGRKDPQQVVIDEVLGQWITLAALSSWSWTGVGMAFALFRLFDIWKPFPVRRLEALPGGVGIIADDLMAGLYGALVLLVVGCFNLY